MARFGNASASSLLRSASSSQNQINAYNDAIQSSVYDNSAKTTDDFKSYQAYLSKRVADTQNLDPTKALTLTNTLRSANRSFNSAEVARATTSTKYGDSSNTDKYNTLASLRQQAIANGDYAQAQTLEGEMASTSVAIQNEAIAAGNRAESASNKADAALNKGYTRAVSAIEDKIKTLNAAKLAGQITPAVFNDQMSQLYLGTPGSDSNPGLINLVQKAAEATGDPNGTWQSKLNGYAADRTIQSFVNGDGRANTAVGNNFTQVIVKNSDGTYGFKQRPDSELATDANGNQVGSRLLTDANGNPVKDAAGHAIQIPQYAGAQAFGDKQGSINGFQYATNIDPTTGQPAPGTGAKALRQIDAKDINHDDPSGIPYFYNEAGQKKFIGAVDENGNNVKPGTPGSHPIMANDPSIIIGKVPTSPESKAKIGGVTVAANDIGGGPASALIKLFHGDDAARARILADAQAKAAATVAQQRADAQAAAQLAAQKAQAVRIGAVAPTPAPVAPKNQYTLPALPAPVPLPGGSGITTPARTGNYKQDVLNLGRSLGGF